MKWFLALFVFLLVGCGNALQTNGPPKSTFGTPQTVGVYTQPTADMRNATALPPIIPTPQSEPTATPGQERYVTVWSAPLSCGGKTFDGKTAVQYLTAIARFNEEMVQVEGQFIEGQQWLLASESGLTDIQNLPNVKRCSR